MRIMADANIIVSAILFPQSTVAKMLAHVVDTHKLVLSQYTIDEVKDVFDKKFPQKIAEMKKFQKEIPYERFILKKAVYKKYPEIRDVDDLPVLANAIESKVDLLVTGDKDFENIAIETPQIMSPREYINKYME